MKNVYSFEEFLEIWNEQPIIILDTNVILDLYRFSSNTCEHILDIFQEVQEHLWLPHQVYFEFDKNYRGVKDKALKKYGEKVT